MQYLNPGLADVEIPIPVDPGACCSFGMRYHIFNPIRVARDCEVEAPISVDPRLP